MTLRELTGELLNLYEASLDPEMDEESIIGMIDLVGDDFEKKAEGYAMVKAELEAKAAAMKAEIDRLTKLKKTIDNSATRIERQLEAAMKATGKVDFSTDLFKFKIKKNPAHLVLKEDLDWNEVPAEFLKWSDPTVVKDEVKKAIKAGQEFDWAHLEQDEVLKIS